MPQDSAYKLFSALVSNNESTLDCADTFLSLSFPVNDSSSSVDVHMKATVACHKNLLKKCRLRITVGLLIASGVQRKSQNFGGISRDSLRRLWGPLKCWCLLDVSCSVIKCQVSQAEDQRIGFWLPNVSN